MQLNPKTVAMMEQGLDLWDGAAWEAIAPTTTDLFDPETNIEYGCQYLAWLKEQFPDQNDAIMAYNAGPNAIKTIGGSATPEAQDHSAYTYLQKVLGHYSTITGGKTPS
jgi:soluble lytic murein transglycosylase-like protein